MQIKDGSLPESSALVSKYNKLKSDVKGTEEHLIEVDDVAKIDLIPGKGEVLTRELSDATGLRGPEISHLRTDRLSYDPKTKEINSYREDVQRISETGDMRTISQYHEKAPGAEVYGTLDTRVNSGEGYGTNGPSVTRSSENFLIQDNGAIIYQKAKNGIVIQEEKLT